MACRLWRLSQCQFILSLFKEFTKSFVNRLCMTVSSHKMGKYKSLSCCFSKKLQATEFKVSKYVDPDTSKPSKYVFTLHGCQPSLLLAVNLPSSWRSIFPPPGGQPFLLLAVNLRFKLRTKIDTLYIFNFLHINNKAQVHEFCTIFYYSLILK